MLKQAMSPIGSSAIFSGVHDWIELPQGGTTIMITETAISAKSVERCSELLSRLTQDFPDSASAAKKLASEVVDPAKASPNQIWNVLWDKPLYANMKVSIADRVESLVAVEMIGAWKVMAEIDGEFAICRIAPGFRKSSFDVRGARAKAIIERAHIAPHRLFAIVGAGRALERRASQYQFPFADLTNHPIGCNVKILKDEFGFGWGWVTILHFLTDLGLASKPDIHVIRTLKALELWPKTKPDHPSINDAIEITEVVRSLAERVMTSASPHSLRQMDKYLMEIDKNNLI